MHKLPATLVSLNSLLLLTLGCIVSEFGNFQHLRFRAQVLVSAHNEWDGEKGVEMEMGEDITISKKVILENTHEDGGEEAGEEQDCYNRVEDGEPGLLMRIQASGIQDSSSRSKIWISSDDSRLCAQVERF